MSEHHAENDLWQRLCAATARRPLFSTSDTPPQTALVQTISAARETWADVTLTAEAFVDHLAEVLNREENRDVLIDQLHTADLYLACACATGDAKAITVCDAAHREELKRALARLSLNAATVDDVLQAMREELFVGGEQRPPYISAFSGRGRLGGWMRVIVVRLALKTFRSKKRQHTLKEADLARLVADPAFALDAPEDNHMKMLYGASFKQAFAAAVTTLSDDERTLLRWHYVLGETIDEIGARIDAHRATAARRINRARDALMASLKRGLRAQLRISEQEYGSVVRLLDSQLDLSIRRLLSDNS
ncbi:MAG: hypothetical protein H6707_11450 [Deltaproteobacteria bacterium]|nr:hypothetical protein [Deltaproteobacteria bacterium]